MGVAVALESLVAGHAVGGEEVDCVASSRLIPTMVDPRRDPRWEPFVVGHAGGRPFHTAGWTDALMSAFGYQPRFHALEDDAGNIAASWPCMLVDSKFTGRRLVAMPFCHGAGPLVRTEEEAEALLQAVLEDARRLRVAIVETRGWPCSIPAPARLQRASPFCAHVLDLSHGPERVLAGVSKDMRYSIRRAERNGLSTREATTLRDFDVFWTMYRSQRRRQALLPQPKDFLKAVFERMVLTGEGSLVMTEYQGRAVAALLSLSVGRSTVGTHSASTPEARTLRAVPLAMWKSIELACRRGSTQFDLGRTDPRAIGLMHFKKDWGAQQQELPYLYWPKPAGLNSRAPSSYARSLLNMYCRTVPEPLFSYVGGKVYRHLG